MGCCSSKNVDVAAKNIHVIQSDHLETINYQSNTGVPPLTPPRRKKTDLIPDVSAFKHIDLHVKNTPNSVTDSVDMLANYLSSKCSNDLEKIRAIFCWLAYNINFDVQGYFSDSKGAQDASSVLRSKKSVCQGYSELCLDLCNSSMLISLPDENTCEIFVRPPKVSKYLLTIFGHAIGDEGESNHSLVKYIIRCNKAKTYVEPFPGKKDAWGFKYPLAAECGIKQVRGAPFMFSAKDGQVNIPVPLCHPTQMTVQMEHACNKHQNMTDFTFINLNEEKAIISARLPRSGYYKLTVFASRPQEKNAILPWVGDLLIYADKAHVNCLPFPLSYTFAGDHCACLLQPLCRQVAPGAKTLFRVHAPRLQTMYIGNSAMQLKNDGVWEAEVIPAKGSLTIFGSVAKNAHSYSGMYAFEVI